MVLFRCQVAILRLVRLAERLRDTWTDSVPFGHRPLIVKLLRVADERLLTQNDLRFLLAERALIVMV